MSRHSHNVTDVKIIISERVCVRLDFAINALKYIFLYLSATPKKRKSTRRDYIGFNDRLI